MTKLPPILAEGFEIGIGVIFLVIWAIAAIVGKLKGAMTPKRPGEPSPVERLQQQIAEQLRQMHGETAVPPTHRPPPIPQRQQSKSKLTRRERRQQQVFADVPPLPPEPVQVSQPVPHAAPLTARPMASAAAPALRRWLRPATLRQQFILTELFQPPMSMREQER